MKRSVLLAAIGAMVIGHNAAVADQHQEGAANFDFYGSFRVGGEYVSPDKTDELSSYWGVRDAYSRIGVNGSYDLGGASVIGQLEIPLDIANMKVQGPYEQNETGNHDAGKISKSVRIAKIGLDTDFGTIAYGQDWLPYYVAIGFSVDRFSSYYSGFATFSNFRLNDMVTYYSPDFSGFSFSAAYINDGGGENASGDYDNRYQATASYNFGNTTLSAGLDNRRGKNNVKLWGLALQQQIPNVANGDVYVGVKLERFSSDIDDKVFGEDGSMSSNLFASYNFGQNTVKAMIADTEHFGETSFHLGYDYQMTPGLLLFAEYYYEQKTAAMTTRRGGEADTVWDADGGQVFTVGARYDF